jgi:integrase
VDCAPSTKKTKRNILQTILRVVYENENLKLRPIRQKSEAIPKYSLSDEQLNKYFKEQKEKDLHLYTAQLLMAMYGLRVSSIAALQVKHLDFLKPGINTITLPDVKAKSQRTLEIIDELKKEIKNYLADFNIDCKDPNTYLFLSWMSGSIAQRSSELCKRINTRLRETKAIEKNRNFKYTSHLFRKTLANEEFQKKLKLIKDAASLRIGQVIATGNIDYYLDNNKNN